MTERTLIVVKPDGIQRHLAGEIIRRFEKKGLKLVAANRKRKKLNLQLGRSSTLKSVALL